MSRKEAKLRVFHIDGSDYRFDVGQFRKSLQMYQKKNEKLNKRASGAYCKKELAEFLGVHEDTVKNWYSSDHGPTTLEYIMKIAEFFDVDYMDLLIEEEGEEPMEQTINVDIPGTEREIVENFYQMVVDLVYLDAGIYQSNIKNKIMTFDNIWRAKEERRTQMYEYIDRNSLKLSPGTRRKLYSIATEMGNSFAGAEGLNARWNRLNPLFYPSLVLFKEGEWFEEDEEDEQLSALERDVFGSVEKRYVAKIDGNDVLCELPKDANLDEVKKRIKAMGRMIPEDCIVTLEPYENGENFGLSYADYFQYEYMKTMLLIFEEDFPEYYGK